MRTAVKKHRVDTSGIHLWLVLWKAFQSVEAHAHRHIASLDLCLSDFGVLEALLHKGPLSVQELGAKVMLTSGAMTAALNRLARRGLIEREEDAKDRRIKIVQLTPIGTDFITTTFEDHKRALESAVSDVSKADRATLVGLLRHLGTSAARSLDEDHTKGKDLAGKSGNSRSRKEYRNV
jgi:MarR family transcriptional regulator, 2-MHQ and catechol-resistance regulon repressor